MVFAKELNESRVGPVATESGVELLEFYNLLLFQVSDDQALEFLTASTAKITESEGTERELTGGGSWVQTASTPELVEL